ncbi:MULTISPECIES: hypothetical protein [unclassified Streptomyces]|uniref:hypothetical protein n=1 Tax=unclassified Streptomyces TaxID=2593676 RepID=UPI0033B133FA|nr:hypothetical protein OH719_20610 [Streptomyces sp. NBC_01653]WTD90813.1 hypothetical protein OG891_26270 [Streptomyces sp. NBC_01637]
MGALTVDPVPGSGHGWDDLVRIWEETDAPEGCKVEIIEGIVTVSPPPSKDHNLTAALLQRRLYSVIPEDWEIYGTHRVLDAVEYGEKLTLPEPFRLDLDTGVFPVS